ncbi:hypothetical protein ACFW2D_21440 [Streptomyces sp. NPDC058914]|uniref:hypothetical protein n=1 Tax=Streptomyces TaxID=1883 RepID=UPI0036988FC1
MGSASGVQPACFSIQLVGTLFAERDRRSRAGSAHAATPVKRATPCVSVEVVELGDVLVGLVALDGDLREFGIDPVEIVAGEVDGVPAR